MTKTMGAVEDNGDVDQQELARQLLAQVKEQGIELVGPNVLNQLTKQVLETALEEEMTEHLGYGKHDPTGRDGGTPAQSSYRSCTTRQVLSVLGPTVSQKDAK